MPATRTRKRGTNFVKCNAAVKGAVETDRSQIDSLLNLSCRIGRDPLLTQASSGNISLKINGTLWVKASGKWLADADIEEILIPLSLTECLAAYRRSEPVPAQHESSGATHLRPSIETFMHAVLPHRVVVHVHSVNAIAWAVRSDAPLQLAVRLFGLRWCWLPYVGSGIPLAREIEIRSRRDPRCSVFVLGNHGLVVCGDDCGRVESALFEVERRLSIPPRVVPQQNVSALEQIQGISGWELPPEKSVHTLGTDGNSRRMVQGGVLYPCQAIFLGGVLPILPRAASMSAVGKRVAGIGSSAPFLVVERCGVLMKKNVSAAEYATLQGYAEVVRRIDTFAPLRYLTHQEVRRVIGGGHFHGIYAEQEK